MNNKWKKQSLDTTLHFCRNNGRFLCMTVSLLLGVLIGSLLVRNNVLLSRTVMESYFRDFISSRSSNPTITVFIFSLLSSCVYLCIAYIMGLFMYGTIPSVFLPAFRGLGIGAVCGYIYLVYGLKGAAFVLLIILPFHFCYSLILLIGCREAMIFSGSMFLGYTKNLSITNMHIALKKYNLRFLVLFLVCAAVAIPDCLFSAIFLDVFGF